MHGRAHAAAISKIDVVAHSDLVAVVNDRRAGQRKKKAVHELYFSSIVAQKRREPSADTEIDPRANVGRERTIHRVALLVGHHLERQLVVISQKDRPLAAGRNRRRLFENVDDRARRKRFKHSKPHQYFAGLFLANVTGGLTNGLTAVANGRNFFTGNLNTSVIDATTVATTNLPSGLSDPKVAKNFLDATDEDFVHVTNNLGKQNILKPGSGLDPDISGYVTKWKYVKDITNPTDFSKVLFRQDLWNSPDILNRFNEGAWILKINAPFRPEYFSPFTNIINGVPQWRYLDFINNSYISPIRFLGF